MKEILVCFEIVTIVIILVFGKKELMGNIVNGYKEIMIYKKRKYNVMLYRIIG